MEDPSLVSCGADPGLVCPFVDNYSIEPAPPTVFSTAPVGSHPAIRIPCRGQEEEEETCMYLNVFIGKKILFIDDDPRGPFLFLYEDAAGKPVAVCTRQTPIPDTLGVSSGRWTLVPRAPTEAADTNPDTGAEVETGNE